MLIRNTDLILFFFFLLTCCIFLSYFISFFWVILFSLLLCCTYIVDIWAVGCIMAEMVRHKILFPGRDCILELLVAVSGISCEMKMASKQSPF